MIPKLVRLSRERFAVSAAMRVVAINSGWLIGDKILRMFVGLLIGAWVTRYLGPEQYGKLAYVIAFMAMFQAFTVLGLDGIIVRDLAQKLRPANEVLGTAAAMRLCASAVAFAAACAAIFALFPAAPTYWLLVALVGMGLFFQTADIVDLWFQSESQSRRTVISKAISYFFAALVKLALVFSAAPLWCFAAVVSMESLISAAALFFAYRKFRVGDAWRFNFVLAKEMLTQSWPFLVSALLIIVYMRGGQFFINRYVDPRSVGLYSAAQVLSELWYFLPMTITASMAPLIARKKASSAAEYEQSLARLFSLMWLISIALSLGISLLAKPIILVLYGASFERSANVLSIHIFTLVPVCLGVAQSVWLINEKKSALAIYQAAVGAVVSIATNLLLIPKFGINGAAFGTVLSQFVQAFAVNTVFAPALVRMQLRALVQPLRALLRLFAVR